MNRSPRTRDLARKAPCLECGRPCYTAYCDACALPDPCVGRGRETADRPQELAAVQPVEFR